jgi:hypothetical protein
LPAHDRALKQQCRGLDNRAGWISRLQCTEGGKALIYGVELRELTEEYRGGEAVCPPAPCAQSLVRAHCARQSPNLPGEGLVVI